MFSGYCNAPTNTPCIKDYSSSDTGTINRLNLTNFRFEPAGSRPGSLLKILYTSANGLYVNAEYAPGVSTSTPAIDLEGPGGEGGYIDIMPADGQADYPSPVVKCTAPLGLVIADWNAYGSVNQTNNCPGAIQLGLKSVTAPYFIGANTPSISGGGSFQAGSNSVTGVITGIAATGNLLTPGFTCPHYVTGIFQSNGGNPISLTARSSTAIQFSGTAGDAVDYHAGCE